jgi:hypothetical protein
VLKAFGEASGGSGGNPMVCLPGKEFRALGASLRGVVSATATAYDGRPSLCVVRELYGGTSETVLGVSDLNASYTVKLANNGRCSL